MFTHMLKMGGNHSSLTDTIITFGVDIRMKKLSLQHKLCSFWINLVQYYDCKKILQFNIAMLVSSLALSHPVDAHEHRIPVNKHKRWSDRSNLSSLQKWNVSIYLLSLVESLIDSL